MSPRGQGFKFLGLSPSYFYTEKGTRRHILTGKTGDVTIVNIG